jgi:hypothetical protein
VLVVAETTVIVDPPFWTRETVFPAIAAFDPFFSVMVMVAGVPFAATLVGVATALELAGLTVLVWKVTVTVAVRLMESVASVAV